MLLSNSALTIYSFQDHIYGGIDFFWFLWKMTTIKMYIIYLEILWKLNKSMKAIIYLQFQVGLAQVLAYWWEGWNTNRVVDLSHQPKVHCLRYHPKQKIC